MNYYLAIDIGASSGRHIVGWKEDGQIRTKEVFRFSNGVKELDGHLVWDIDYLEDKVREGIEIADDELMLLANRWQLKHAGYSGRTARQLVDYLLGSAT